MKTSTIEIKTAVLPCREINTKIMPFLLILSHFRQFSLNFSDLFIDFCHFIDHFYNIFRP